MSRAFKKESDNDPGPVLPTGPRGPYYVTRAGLKKLPANDERRARVEIIVVDKNAVGIGAVVTVRDDRGKKAAYAIVNDEDAAPLKGSIGISSPLAQAMLDKNVGDNATWHRPIGDATLTVEAIDYD